MRQSSRFTFRQTSERVLSSIARTNGGDPDMMLIPVHGDRLATVKAQVIDRGRVFYSVLPAEIKKIPATTSAAPAALRKVTFSIRLAISGARTRTNTA